MSSLRNRLPEILLYPVKFFENLTDKKSTLYAGIIFVGIIDLFSPDFINRYKTLFTGKPISDVGFNIFLALVLVGLFGLIDTVFMAFPLYDLFRFIKKKEDQTHNASLIKVLKVYVMSHFLIIPVNVVLHYALFRNINENSSVLLINLSIAYFFIALMWSSAIISRGINTLFNVSPLFQRFTLLIVFVWNFLLGWVFSLQLVDRLTGLFR